MAIRTVQKMPGSQIVASSKQIDIGTDCLSCFAKAALRIHHDLRLFLSVFVAVLFLRRSPRKNLIDNTNVLRFLCAEISVTVHHLFHVLWRVLLSTMCLVQVFPEYLVELFSRPLYLIGVDENVAGLSLCTSQRLVDHDTAVWKRISLPLFSARQQ